MREDGLSFSDFFDALMASGPGPSRELRLRAAGVFGENAQHAASGASLAFIFVEWQNNSTPADGRLSVLRRMEALIEQEELQRADVDEDDDEEY